MPGAYSFRPATLQDLPLLRWWQQQSHVRQWWGDGDPFDEIRLNEPWVSRRIVERNGRPFAYMQDYSVHAEPDHHFAHLPPGSRGIDQYIGDPAMLGRGHGTALIRQRMTELFAAGAPAIGTDPHPDNARVISVYGKLGFLISGPPQQTPWGLILPMQTIAP